VKDILISYAPADRAWADWLAWTLEENDYPVQLQPLQATPQVTGKPTSQLLLLSAHADSTPPALASDHRVVRVADVSLPEDGELAGAPCLDLFDTTEAEATQALIDFLATPQQGSPAFQQQSNSQQTQVLQPGTAVAAATAMPSTLSTGTFTLSSPTVSTEELAVQDEGYAYRDQLKLRRRTATVQGYTEPLTDNVGLAMVLIPGGTFLMGSPEDEPERLDHEGPQHEVTVPQFFMGKYPVTQAEWRFVAGLPQVNRELKPNPSHFAGDRHPVESVSWYEAVEFCDRLSLHTGRTYRLPSEAEWEYACRAGTTTPFHFGETITTDLANYDGTDDPEGHWSGSYDRGPKGEYRQTTTPVDHFDITNSFGLCDMHGNVWEWCLDHYHDSYEDAPEDGSAWIDAEAKENKSRIRRGGSWLNYPGFCRSAYRSFSDPRGSDDYIGFRVICVSPRALQ
jgi:formylglycine-generating enzyme required for sulfatase activity